MNASNLTFKQLERTPAKKVLLDFESDAGWPLSKNALRKVRADKPSVRWVCVQANGMPIGLAQLELAPPQFCYLSHLVIKSEYRGRGIGRWFLEHIEQMTFSMGIPRLLLTPEERSIPFYQALNFQPDPLVPGVLKKEVFFLKKSVPGRLS